MYNGFHAHRSRLLIAHWQSIQREKLSELVSVYNGFLANRSPLIRAHCQSQDWYILDLTFANIFQIFPELATLINDQCTVHPEREKGRKKSKLVSVYNGFLANRSRLPRAHCQLCPRPTDCKKRFYCHVVKFASINLWIYRALDPLFPPSASVVFRLVWPEL